MLDKYFPVIELARKVKMYYCGTLDGQPRVCSDVVGELIAELGKAEKGGKIGRDEPVFDESSVTLTVKQRMNLNRIINAARGNDGRE